MKNMMFLFLLPAMILAQENAPSPETILKKVDDNMISKTSITESQMVIPVLGNSRTVTSKGYAKGEETAFTEYLAPAREKGTFFSIGKSIMSSMTMRSAFVRRL